MFADITHFKVGSDTLELTPFYLKRFPIPAVTAMDLTLPTRAGTKLHLGADTVDFDVLNLEIPLDKNFEVWLELYTTFMKGYNFEQGTYAPQEFELWATLENSAGKEILRFDFLNCRILSIGEVLLDLEQEPGTTVSVGIAYDYFTTSKKIERFYDV